jgi:uncharacterized protein (DUF924 family)
MAIATQEEVIDFWFTPQARARWFQSTSEFDREVMERFEATWHAGRDGALQDWLDTAEGALALVIVLDQFPLNMFRGRPEAFATEAAARRAADSAIERGFDRTLDDERRGFLYLPFMHSEDPADQERSVALYRAAGLTGSLKWAEHHRELIRRFGRFPHRNAILGRGNTAHEQAYLGSETAFRG